MNLIALHEVHVCRKPGAKGVRPETEKIPPKGKFEIGDKEGQELIALGAAVLDPDADTAKASKAADKAAKKAADDAAKKAAEDEAAKKAAEEEAAKKAAEDEDTKLV